MELKWCLRYGITVVCLTAVSAQAQLFNGGFEINDGSLVGWSTFNNSGSNVTADSSTPRTGSHSAKVFGGFNGNPNYSGLLQNLPASAAQEWQASAFARTNSADSILGSTNELLVKIEFYRVANGTYGTSDVLAEHAMVVMNGADTEDIWHQQTLIATAPSDTVEARIAFVFIQRDNAGGSVFIDDVEFGLTDPPEPVNWVQIWSDEFDGPDIDLTKWRIEDLHLIKNNEQQYYAPDDAYIENGKLVLRSQDREYSGFDSDGNWGTWDYTSGLIESPGKFATAYGRIEARAKLPSTQGIWPAIWTLPEAGVWPPEIDIMELLGHESNKVYMTHHWGNWPVVHSDGGSFTGPDFAADFHTFAVEWFPNRIDWYVDDVLRFSSNVNIPQQPFYIILNTAVGGNWPGNPDGSTVFPQYHEIDYVRVFMRDDPGDAAIEATDDTPGVPVVDGVVSAGEYAWSTPGINDGFGDFIGENSTLSVDAGAALHLGIESAAVWPPTWNGGVVFYIDTEPGGFASTIDLHDFADSSRAMTSGSANADTRADLYFPMGFLADYAVTVMPTSISVYRLDRLNHELLNGADLDASLDFEGGQDVVYRWDNGSQGQLHREIAITKELIGLTEGGTMRYFGTLINGLNANRSNEFFGIPSGNAWDGSNIGANWLILDEGDFAAFNLEESGPMNVPAVSEWLFVAMIGLFGIAGTIVFGRNSATSCDKILADRA